MFCSSSHGGQILSTRDILLAVAADIELELTNFAPLEPKTITPAVSTWLASALLQKAIRRGYTDLALAAAGTLLQDDSAKLWRRLSVIAVEDVGLGGLDALYIAITASSSRRHLAARFGVWRLVSFVVSKLASCPKCRCTDDLHVATEFCSAWQADRLELAHVPFSDLLDVIASNDRMARRAIAVRYAIGTSDFHGKSSLMIRRGKPQLVFDLLWEMQPNSLVEISREAYRQTREPFAAFMPLLFSAYDGADTEVQSDVFPPEANIGGLPSYALDGFSREGRAALSMFLNTDCATTRWLRQHVGAKDRASVLRRAQFQVEAGLVKDRLIWPVGIELLHQADLHSWPV